MLSKQAKDLTKEPIFSIAQIVGNERLTQAFIAVKNLLMFIGFVMDVTRY